MAIVTISRKLGSLGDDIALLVAQKLGYRLVTREEFHRIGLECDREFRDACQLFETEKGRGSFPGPFSVRPDNQVERTVGIGRPT